MKRKPWSFIMMLTLVFTLLASSSALAFADLEGDPGEASIQALKDQGIISGLEDGSFAPKAPLSYAQAVTLMVDGFGLSLDRFRFIKQPEASDYFSQVPNGAWYAEKFIIAQLNGLPIPKDVNPEALVTREQYADLLSQAMLTQGQYAFITIYILLGDESDVDAAYMNSIQTLLISKIAKLDQNQNFLPKKNITRSDAAIWLHQAMTFVKEQEANKPAETIDVSVKAVHADVNEVSLIRGEKPSPGYGISIESIAFTDKKAILRYRLYEPLPGHMYPAMVVEVKAATYVPSQYEIEIEEIK
jgi:hypothetical protein